MCLCGGVRYVLACVLVYVRNYILQHIINEVIDLTKLEHDATQEVCVCLLVCLCFDTFVHIALILPA